MGLLYLYPFTIPGPTQPRIQWVPRFFGGGTGRGRDVDHSPPSTAKVRNAWSKTFTPTIYLHDMHRDCNFFYFYCYCCCCCCFCCTLSCCIYYSFPVPLKCYQKTLWRHDYTYKICTESRQVDLGILVSFWEPITLNHQKQWRNIVGISFFSLLLRKRGALTYLEVCHDSLVTLYRLITHNYCILRYTIFYIEKKITEYSTGILWSTSTRTEFVTLHCTKQGMLIKIENSSMHHDMMVSVRVLNVTSVTSFSGDRAWNMGTEMYESKWYILAWCSSKQLRGRIVSMVTGMEYIASRIFTVPWLQNYWANYWHIVLSHIIFLSIQLRSGLGHSSSSITGNDCFICSFK